MDNARKYKNVKQEKRRKCMTLWSLNPLKYKSKTLEIHQFEAKKFILFNKDKLRQSFGSLFFYTVITKRESDYGKFHIGGFEKKTRLMIHKKGNTGIGLKVNDIEIYDEETVQIEENKSTLTIKFPDQSSREYEIDWKEVDYDLLSTQENEGL